MTTARRRKARTPSPRPAPRPGVAYCRGSGRYGRATFWSARCAYCSACRRLVTIDDEGVLGLHVPLRQPREEPLRRAWLARVRELCDLLRATDGEADA